MTGRSDALADEKVVCYFFNDSVFNGILISDGAV